MRAHARACAPSRARARARAREEQRERGLRLHQLPQAGAPAALHEGVRGLQFQARGEQEAGGRLRGDRFALVVWLCIHG